MKCLFDAAKKSSTTASNDDNNGGESVHASQSNDDVDSDATIEGNITSS